VQWIHSAHRLQKCSRAAHVYLEVRPTVNCVFYKIVIPIILLISVAVGGWLSLNQQNAGKGVAELSNESTMSGYLTLGPYPVLHNVGKGKRSVILVDRFNKSANELLQPYVNQWITLSGLLIVRGDWTMLQVPVDADVQLVSSNTEFDVATRRVAICASQWG
jgi:hypothetical protein